MFWVIYVMSSLSVRKKLLVLIIVFSLRPLHSRRLQNLWRLQACTRSWNLPDGGGKFCVYFRFPSIYLVSGSRPLLVQKSLWHTTGFVDDTCFYLLFRRQEPHYVCHLGMFDHLVWGWTLHHRAKYFENHIWKASDLSLRRYLHVHWHLWNNDVVLTRHLARTRVHLILGHYRDNGRDEFPNFDAALQPEQVQGDIVRQGYSGNPGRHPVWR